MSFTCHLHMSSIENAVRRSQNVVLVQNIASAQKVIFIKNRSLEWKLSSRCVTSTQNPGFTILSFTVNCTYEE